jgi:4-amino-4-deoxy-L-arabinose transferase-like glycosyltransferase
LNDRERTQRREPSRSTRDATLVGLAKTIAFVAVGCCLLLNLGTLGRGPLINCDEPFFSEPAWAMSQGHPPAHAMFPGQFGLDKSDVAHGRLFFTSVATSFAIGGRSLLAARLPIFLMSIALLVALYFLVRQLYDDNTALVAVAVLAVSYQFFVHSRIVRPEPMLMVFQLAAIACLLASARSERQRSLLFAAGLLGGLSADVHLNGAALAAVLVALFLARFGVRELFGPKGAWFALGLTPGAAWWLLVHVVPDPSLFSRQWNTLWNANASAVRGLLQPMHVVRALPSLLKAEFDRQLLFMANPANYRFTYPQAALGLIALAAVAYRAGKRQDTADRFLIVWFLATLITMALAFTNKTSVYALVLLPAACTVVARSAVLAYERVGSPAWLAIFWSLLLLVSAGPAVKAAREASSYDIGAYVAQGGSAIPSGAVVMGLPRDLWFGMQDHRFVTAEGPADEQSLGTRMDQLGVGYVAIRYDDAWLAIGDTRLFVGDETVSSGDLLAAARAHGVLVASVPGTEFGYPDRIEIYRLR